MKIITYSDLHLEFGSNWLPPENLDGDVIILAGDIISFKNYTPLDRLLVTWNKPVVYVAGNHEYYTQKPMTEGENDFKLWLAAYHPNVVFLQDQATIIDGVNFFGGTMWTNFNNADPFAMGYAEAQMNDFRLIKRPDETTFKSADTLTLHDHFVSKLVQWFEQGLPGPHVVISHHAPVINPNSQYKTSPLRHAFNSLDMVSVIEKYQPYLWVYGHTHECDDQMIGKTRVISNQLGYPKRPTGFECTDFNEGGLVVEL